MRLVFHLSLLFSSLVSLSAAFGEQVSARPNILVLIADDLGYGELGCYGGDLPTPNLDALAKRGVRCTNAYVTAPFCAASRAVSLAKAKPSQSLDGVDLIPLLSNPMDGRPIHETLYWRVGSQAALRLGDWKAYRPREPKAARDRPFLSPFRNV